MTDDTRLFSADSHCVITTEQVKQNLASRYHDAWQDGMAKYDAKRRQEMDGGSLELEDFVDLEAARHPGYFEPKAVRQLRGTAANQIEAVDHVLVSSGMSAAILGHA